MKTIPLTQGKVALVDDEDYERVIAHKWRAALVGHPGNLYWRAVATINGRDVVMDRMLLGLQRVQEVDHKNLETLDNQRCNLRPCTHSQNNANRRKWQTDVTSGFKGVSAHGARWRADCGKRYIGIFDTEAAAGLAYDAKARELFGEFARCNFPDEAH